MKLIRHPHELSGKKVVVLGIGCKDGGVFTALFARRCGAEVLALDLKDEASLKPALAELDAAGIRHRLGPHDPADINWADIILTAPGIRRDRGLLASAADQGKAVDSAIGIFMEAAKGPIIGVTGTKGKSLTAHLVGHILSRAGRPTLVAGNNCVSPLRALSGGQTDVVLELSSWQLAQTGLHERSPAVSCWLNFFPDHMNYYRDMDEYRADKMNITGFQTPSDFLVLPWHDPALAGLRTRARPCYFSTTCTCGTRIPERNVSCNQAGELVMIWEGRRFSLPLTVSELSANYPPHHRGHVLAAVMCAWAAGCHRPDDVRAVLDFPGLPHRLERVAGGGGNTYINDSAATTPRSAAYAVSAVTGRPLVLICGGGNHKRLPYPELAALIPDHVDRLILFTDDEASDEAERLLPSDYIKSRVDRVSDMPEAVREGIDWLREHGPGTLLLSPGCAGAPRFQDLYERGDLFRRYVREFAP